MRGEKEEDSKSEIKRERERLNRGGEGQGVERETIKKNIQFNVICGLKDIE